MATKVTTKSLFHQETATTTSTSYANPTYRSIWLYTAGNWDGTVTAYLEAVISTTSGGTAYATLSTTGGSNVSGAEVTTTSTSATRVRSSDFVANLTDESQYQIRIKASSGATTTLYNAKLIIKQTGTITKSEYYIPLTGGYSTTTSTSTIDHPYTSFVGFDTDQWDGTYSTYLEATGYRTGSGSNYGFGTLYNITDSTADGSATIFNSSTVSRVRSSALTMASGAKEYKFRFRTTSAFNTNVTYDACIVVVQSGSPTKGVLHDAVKAGYQTTTSTSDLEFSGGKLYWDDDEYSLDSQTIYYEATMYNSSGSYTTYSDFNDGTNDDASLSTSATSKTRITSTSFNPDDNTEYIAQYRSSNASGTAYIYVPRVISVITWSGAGGTAIKDIIGGGNILFPR